MAPVAPRRERRRHGAASTLRTGCGAAVVLACALAGLYRHHTLQSARLADMSYYRGYLDGKAETRAGGLGLLNGRASAEEVTASGGAVGEDGARTDVGKSVAEVLGIERDISLGIGGDDERKRPGWKRRMDINGQYYDPDDRMRLVFSTDCRPYQNWQSVVLLHSASEVKQRGKFVRIVSGCQSDAQREEALLVPSFGLRAFETHFAPPARNDSYPQQNRPDGLVDWLENSIDPPANDDLVVVLDPDMAFMKPLSNRPENLEWAKRWRIAHDEGESLVAGPGHPVAQGYAIGPYDEYVEICKEMFGGDEETEGCQREAAMGRPHGWRYYSIGAPYLTSAGDLRKLAPLWSELTPPTWRTAKAHGHGGLLSDMFAYSMAAAHLGLRFTRLESFMISDPVVGPIKRDNPAGNWHYFPEGWEMFDNTYLTAEPGDDLYDAHPCRNPEHRPIRSKDPNATLPVLLHYCQSLRVPRKIHPDQPPALEGLAHPSHRNFGWSKYRNDDNTVMQCAHPLLMEPWAPNQGIDVMEADKNIYREKAQGLKTMLVEGRNVFEMCQTMLMFNEAMVAYKKVHCPAGFNANKTWLMGAV